MESTGRRSGNGWQWGTRAAVTAVALAAPLTAVAAERGAQDAAKAKSVSVIVREYPGTGNGPERAVKRLGGRVVRQIKLINGFSAKLPKDRIDDLRSTRGVQSVTISAKVTMATPVDGWDPVTDPGSTHTLSAVTGATAYWRRGYTGTGVDVAVIDSGVTPVEGLNGSDKLIYGPDLSFESQSDENRHLDTYGHGTHMAGIIAGRDDSDPADRSRGSDARFMGVAPDARIVSVKVADRNGATDVSQVIAAIDWVVQHRYDNGLNIRVLNLSFGTDGVQDYRLDPLAYAVEAAWRKGIVVVVSAGNAGFGSPKLNNPAYDPYVIAVGASDPKGTASPADDEVPSWSSSGDAQRRPDLLAPGKSVVSLRAPGSSIDAAAPAGRVGNTRFFRGSGTSQSAALVSGAVALMLDRHPYLTPDQVKAMLVRAADPITAPYAGQAAKVIDLRGVMANRVPRARTVTQTWERATGTGSLDAARGTRRLVLDGVVLDGERDIFGMPWNGSSWSADMWNGVSWTGGVWNGSSWSGSSWSGSSWSGSSWSGSSWSGSSWSGSSWSGSSWSGSSWSGSSWSGVSWTGSSWSGSSWSGSSWSGNGWGE